MSLNATRPRSIVAFYNVASKNLNQYANSGILPQQQRSGRCAGNRASHDYDVIRVHIIGLRLITGFHITKMVSWSGLYCVRGSIDCQPVGMICKKAMFTLSDSASFR